MARRDWAGSVLVVLFGIAASALMHEHEHLVGVGLWVLAAVCGLVIAYDVGHERGQRQSRQSAADQARPLPVDPQLTALLVASGTGASLHPAKGAAAPYLVLSAQFRVANKHGWEAGVLAGVFVESLAGRRGTLHDKVPGSLSTGPPFGEVPPLKVFPRKSIIVGCSFAVPLDDGEPSMPYSGNVVFLDQFGGAHPGGTVRWERLAVMR